MVIREIQLILLEFGYVSIVFQRFHNSWLRVNDFYDTLIKPWWIKVHQKRVHFKELHLRRAMQDIRSALTIYIRATSEIDQQDALVAIAKLGMGYCDSEHHIKQYCGLGTVILGFLTMVTRFHQPVGAPSKAGRGKKRKVAPSKDSENAKCRRLSLAN
jgi:hypothetical protein